MKILELIDSVDKTYMNRFENVIRNHRNQRLMNLHMYLTGIKKQADYSKEDAYSAVFGEDYDPKKDYLLRNELRHYHNLIRDELAHSEISESETTLNFLRYLLRKRLLDQFKIELKRAEKRFKRSEDFRSLSDVQSLKFEYLYRHEFSVDKPTIESLHGTLQTRYHANQLHADTVSRELEVANSFLKLNAVKLGISTPDNLQSTRDTGIYARYLTAKKQSFETNGDLKIEHLLNALELIQQVDPVITDTKKEALVIRNNLALEYFFRREYDKAIDVYKKAFNDRPNQKDGALSAIYYNYISALLKSGHYAQADKLFTTEHVSLEDIPGMKNKFLGLKIMNHVLNANPLDARRMIPEKLNEGSEDDYLYIRLCLSIVYYLEDKFDLCERENRNIVQAASRDEHLSAYAFCANAFNKFLRYNDAKQLKKLFGQVNRFTHDLSVRHSDILPLLWLKNQIDSKINIS